MSDTKRSFLSVQNKQRKIGKQNNFLVLFYLARFSFLTSHQLSKLVNVEHSSMRHILRRLLFRRKICETKFPECSTKAYSLSRSGAIHARFSDYDNHALDDVFVKYGNPIFDNGYNYHRVVTNDFLIDLVTERINFHELECEHYVTEHEISSNESMYMQYMGCIPDSLAISTDDRLIVIESENTYRGKRWHGPKLFSWLNACADRFEREGCFADEYPKPVGVFSDVEQVFICTNELNFRSMYRMIERELANFEAFKQNISYWVIDKKSWVNPASRGELLMHDDVETLERVKKGSRLYKKSDEFMLSVLYEVKNNPDILIDDIAKKHDISRSTIGRWNLKFNYIYKR